MHRAPTSLLLSGLVLVASMDLRADWPEFRGSTHTGHAPDANVPLKWSNSENIRWQIEIPGRAWSTPVVAG
ncbi:MAG: hypothetical protein VXX36_11395, partial [Verrucomicrobiota bacterium]|nr:hypothetical protein [Verrucomicrobiota bacterium]